MKKKNTFSNFGFSTILLCFVMICVVIFSALSLVSAYSDYKLSQKVAEKNSAYYEAQQRAYDKLASIDAEVCHLYKLWTAPDEYGEHKKITESFHEWAGRNLSAFGEITLHEQSFTLSFTETIAEDHFLEIALEIRKPTYLSDSFIEITAWKSYYDQETPGDDILDLIQ